MQREVTELKCASLTVLSKNFVVVFFVALGRAYSLVLRVCSSLREGEGVSQLGSGSVYRVEKDKENLTLMHHVFIAQAVLFFELISLSGKPFFSPSPSHPPLVSH